MDRTRLAAIRSAAQLLNRPSTPASVADIVEEIGGVQDQEPPSGRLALRSRSARLTAGDVDRARTEERSIVRGWCMRGTVHLIAAGDAEWLFPLYDAKHERESRRRLAVFGMDTPTVDRALREVEAVLTSDGPMPRPVLMAHLRAKGFELVQQHHIHLSRVATAAGIAAFGPDQGKRTCLVLAADWLEPRRERDRETALAELARRYLRGFAPATEVDFAGWSGLPLRDVRAGLAAISGELKEIRLGGQTAYALRRAARKPGSQAIRLLSAFDTYLMGNRDRDFIAAGPRWTQIAPGGGVLRPTILRDGAALGTWSIRRAGGRARLTLEPYEELDAATMSAVEAEVADIGRFEGTPAQIDAVEVTGV